MTIQPLTLTWSEVLPAAQVCFNIWVDQPELRWAKVAWRHMIDAGLASYASAAELTRAKLRFLSMVLVYHDWCHVACDERDNFDDAVFADWCESLLLDPALFAREHVELPDNPEAEDSKEWVREVGLHCILDEAESERSSVVRALVTGFKGKAALFGALDQSTTINNDDDDSWGNSTRHEVEGYQWVQEGCPRVQ